MNSISAVLGNINEINSVDSGDRQKGLGKKKEVRMQGNSLYVGNLGYSVTEEQLRELFSDYGEVRQVRMIPGRDFGFVEMSSSSEAEAAKTALNGSDFEGRTLKVDEARPPRSGGSGGYRRY